MPLKATPYVRGSWSTEAKAEHESWWMGRVARQTEIDKSIAAKADSEFLFDKPCNDPSRVRVAGPFTVESLSPHRTLAKAAEAAEGQKFSSHFLFGEWSDVVDAWQLRSWEDYRDVSRLGRKTRIGGKQREVLWSIFDRVRAGLIERKAVTWSDIFGRLTERLLDGAAAPFDFIVVDEAQDISVAEARFLAAMAQGRSDGLFFTGDLGQRIFQQPFSWKALGLDVRGRSSTLRITPQR
jgi:hypothetical protein